MADIWNRYAATAARPTGRSGRDLRAAGACGGGPTIDIHAHVIAPAAAALVRPHLRRPPEPFPADTLALGARQSADRASRMTTLDNRLGELDAMAIDRQVVMPAPGQCYHDLPVDLAIQAARLVNEGVAAFAARRPDRFIPFGTVPMQDGAAAAAELAHCRDVLGFKGVQVLTNVGGAELSDPRFAAFWAAAERLGVLVVIHPAGYTEPARLARFYFNNVIGNPLDTTVALHHLIFDGVLARHPALKLLAVHGGGYLPAYSGRIDHAWGARSDAHGALPLPPTSYLRQVYFDSIVFTPHQLENLVRVFGADHILMGTDYPFDMGEYDPVGHVAGVAGFDIATVAAVCGGNAVRLLGL
ncbi:MAG: amidohydrolase [Rhodospirillales bacterium]|nr:amidohydrolase [Rhodospirillales bacterium]